MRYWIEKFNLDKEDFTFVPVWIWLYSLPQEFWNEEVLFDIGNTLGNYIKIAEITRQKRYKAFTRICVYMNVSCVIPESITLSYEDFEWIQTLDYEFIPFRCKRCHEHGRLFHDFPLEQYSNPPPNKTLLIMKLQTLDLRPSQKNSFLTLCVMHQLPNQLPK